MQRFVVPILTVAAAACAALVAGGGSTGPAAAAATPLPHHPGRSTVPIIVDYGRSYGSIAMGPSAAVIATLPPEIAQRADTSASYLVVVKLIQLDGPTRYLLVPTDAASYPLVNVPPIDLSIAVACAPSDRCALPESAKTATATPAPVRNTSTPAGVRATPRPLTVPIIVDVRLSRGSIQIGPTADVLGNPKRAALRTSSAAHRYVALVSFRRAHRTQYLIVPSDRDDIPIVTVPRRPGTVR